MTPIHIVIPGEPVAKGMPRVVPVYGRDKKPVLRPDGRVLTRVYTPKVSADWMLLVKRIGQDAIEKPLEGPVSLNVEAWFTLPKSRHRKRVPTVASWKRTKPDVKNILAGIEDGLKGVAWLDDNQVVHVLVMKFYCAQEDNRPRTEIVIEELT